MRAVEGTEEVGTISLQLTGDGYVSTVSRIAPDGALSWRLHPPAGEDDVFVSVAVRPDELILTSWSGWLVRVDPASGTERGRECTK